MITRGGSFALRRVMGSLRLSHILVPFDHSDLSAAALDYALGLARVVGAGVLVFHASGPVEGGSDTHTRERHDADKALTDALLSRRERSPVEITQIVRWISADEGISRVAAEVDADLVVMGTHGRRGLARAFLGSVAEGVLRSSARPVLTVRVPEKSRSVPPGRILAATDFSVASRRALAYAVELASLVGARLTFAHVLSTPLPILTGETSLVTSEVLDQAVVSASAALEDAAAPARAQGVPTDTLLREGDAARALPDMAAEAGADLIVLGTRGRRGIVRAVLGSVAEQVLRTAEVPVLTLRAEE
jgi:nucleotide-binding universal stress UspA family protein